MIIIQHKTLDLECEKAEWFTEPNCVGSALLRDPAPSPC